MTRRDAKAGRFFFLERPLGRAVSGSRGRRLCAGALGGGSRCRLSLLSQNMMEEHLSKHGKHGADAAGPAPELPAEEKENNYEE